MRFRNVLLFLLLAGVWGTAFMAIKAGLAYLPPVLFAALRYDVAGLLVLGYAAYATDQWRPRGRKQWTLAGIGAVFIIAGYHAFLFVGEQTTTSAAAAVVVSLSPILTTGFSRALLPDERLTAVGLLGLGLGLAGVAVLARPDPATVLAGRLGGELLVFAAACAFALGSVLTQVIDAELPIETMEAWAMVGGAVLLHGGAYAIGERLGDIVWTPQAVAALGYLALVASAAGFLVYFDLLDRLGPIEINLVSYVAPVFAALSGALVLGERLDALTVLGFVIIVSGFVLVKRESLGREWPRLRKAFQGS